MYNRLIVVKKQGCDWGACGRPRRRDLATSLALRDGRGEGGSARGQGPRDWGLSLRASLATKRGLAAEKSQKNSSRALRAHGCFTLHAERWSMKVYMYICGVTTVRGISSYCFVRVVEVRIGYVPQPPGRVHPRFLVPFLVMHRSWVSTLSIHLSCSILSGQEQQSTLAWSGILSQYALRSWVLWTDSASLCGGLPDVV